MIEQTITELERQGHRFLPVTQNGYARVNTERVLTLEQYRWLTAHQAEVCAYLTERARGYLREMRERVEEETTKQGDVV